MSALAWLDLMALAALAGAACALRPRSGLACRLVGLALVPATAGAWLAAHSPWLARAGWWVLVVLSVVALGQALAVWRSTLRG